MRVNGYELGEKIEFTYLGLTVRANGCMEVEVSYILNEGTKITGSLGFM